MACLFHKEHWCYQNQCLSQKHTATIKYKKLQCNSLQATDQILAFCSIVTLFSPQISFQRPLKFHAFSENTAHSTGLRLLRDRNWLLPLCKASCLFPKSGGNSRSKPVFKTQLNFCELSCKVKKGLTEHRWQQGGSWGRAGTPWLLP